MQYNTVYSENIHSYVNNIITIEGGTHLTGFRRGLTTTLKNYAEKSGMLSKLKFDIDPADFREGLTTILSVKVNEPQFEGQTKTKLGNSEVEGDSAGGTAKNGRDRAFQAILPLRGKILNVEKAQEHRVFENEEIRNIYTAFGVPRGTEEASKALNMD